MSILFKNPYKWYHWKDFALISPDYWRKFLLDYNSLGADYKYGEKLTAFELEIIDKKLDLYMERKALAGEMPHLLIDRFRFDSFIVGGDGNYTSRLLTRFGQKVFLFFNIIISLRNFFNFVSK